MEPNSEQLKRSTVDYSFSEICVVSCASSGGKRIRLTEEGWSRDPMNLTLTSPAV